MVRHCAGLGPGQSLLIVAEESDDGYYDPALAPAVAEAAGTMGIAATVVALPFCAEAEPLPPPVVAASAAADRTLFLSRRGDQLRFDGALAAMAPVVCYALDRAMMASGFGCADHRAFVALLGCLNDALARARQIRVTCPLGTDFAGPGARFGGRGGEVTVRRFPLSVFSPVPATDYAGTVAVAGFLTGTGKTLYQPHDLPLGDVLTVRFRGDRIIGFDGSDAAAAAAHYDRVGALLGLDARHVHSWHAGIHPGCAYPESAATNPARWGGSAFGNPRVLHFHTCGAEAPGEISLNVIDPTIRVDDVALWEDGRLFPERAAGGADILARYPDVAELFRHPARAVGLDSHGRLPPCAPPQGAGSASQAASIGL
jgi:hypothetical protein